MEIINQFKLFNFNENIIYDYNSFCNFMFLLYPQSQLNYIEPIFKIIYDMYVEDKKFELHQKKYYKIHDKLKNTTIIQYDNCKVIIRRNMIDEEKGWDLIKEENCYSTKLIDQSKFIKILQSKSFIKHIVLSINAIEKHMSMHSTRNLTDEDKKNLMYFYNALAILIIKEPSLYYRYISFTENHMDFTLSNGMTLTGCPHTIGHTVLVNYFFEKITGGETSDATIDLAMYAEDFDNVLYWDYDV